VEFAQFRHYLPRTFQRSVPQQAAEEDQINAGIEEGITLTSVRIVSDRSAVCVLFRVANLLDSQAE
jgi:hypothetical protein